MTIKYLFFIRNIRLVKLCAPKARSDVKLALQDPCMWFIGAYIKNRRWKILMWFTEAYIKNSFVKLIFKTFTLENSKKKGSEYIKNTPPLFPRKSYGRHFEIIIELTKFTISSFKWMQIPSHKYKFKQIFKKICQTKALYLSYVFPRIINTLLLFLLERRYDNVTLIPLVLLAGSKSGLRVTLSYLTWTVKSTLP